MVVKKSQSTTVNQTFVDPTVTKYDGLVRLRVSNLSPDVTEYDFRSIFGKFGPILRTDLPTDKDSGNRLSFGFITYNSFEIGDAVIEKMSKQYLAARQITVEYAIKNAETGERYGNPTDRLLLSKAEQNNITLLPDVDLSTIGTDMTTNHPQNNSNFNQFQQQQQQQQPNQPPPNNQQQSSDPRQYTHPDPTNPQFNAPNPNQPPPPPDFSSTSFPNMPSNIPLPPPPNMLPQSHQVPPGMQSFPPNQPFPPIHPNRQGPPNPTNMMNLGPNMMNSGPGMMNPMMFSTLTPQQQQNFLLSLVKTGQNPMLFMQSMQPRPPNGMGPNPNMPMGPPQNGPPIHPQFGPPPPWVQNQQQYNQWVQQMSSGQHQ
jgi:RNA recognition motif-containing protein